MAKSWLIGLAMAASFLVILVIGCWALDKINQNATEPHISFRFLASVKTPSGESESYVKALIYELRTDGKTTLMKALEARDGIVDTVLSVRKMKQTPSWWRDEWDPIYATVNLRLWIFGSHGEVAIGIPVDPLIVEKEGKLALSLIERPYPNGEVFGEDVIKEVQPLSLEYQETTHKLTHVITFHSWDNVSAYFHAGYGSKYSEPQRVRESTENPPGSGNWNVGNWYNSGETVATIDHAFSTSSITGCKRQDVKMDFYYKYERWDYWLGSYHRKKEYSYLLDTSNDPLGNDVVAESPLSGNGVSDPWNYGHYAYTSQGTMWSFPVYGHGGEKLCFDVTVGFSAQWPHGVGVNVSFKVWKEYQAPAPMFIWYTVGSYYSGYKFYAYDRNTGDMRLYATWAIPP